MKNLNHSIKIIFILLFTFSCATDESNDTENVSKNFSEIEQIEINFRDDLKPIELDIKTLKKLNQNVIKRIPVTLGTSLFFNLQACPVDTDISIRVKQNFENPSCQGWGGLYISVDPFLFSGLYYTHQSYIDLGYYDVLTGNYVQLTGDVNDILEHTTLNPSCDCGGYFYNAFPYSSMPSTFYIRLRKIENSTGCESTSQTLTYTPFQCI